MQQKRKKRSFIDQTTELEFNTTPLKQVRTDKSIQQVMTDYTLQEGRRKLNELDYQEISDLRQYDQYKHDSQNLIAALINIKAHDLLSEMAQSIVCKMQQNEHNIVIFQMLLDLLALTIDHLSVQDKLNLCEMLLMKQININKIVGIFLQLLFLSYSEETKNQIIRWFRFLNNKLDQAINTSIQKIKFMGAIKLETNPIIQESNLELLQLILESETSASRIFMNLMFTEDFSNQRPKFISFVMKYQLKPASQLMKIFIKRLQKLNEDQVVESSTFWFLCQQTQTLDKGLRRVALHALSMINYQDEEDLKHLLFKEKGNDQLFTLRESNWMKPDTFFLSSAGLLIFALEDELADIRKEALHCMVNFSKQSPAFKKECREMLVYMLNDENDDVRISAVNALKQIYDPFTLKRSELDIVKFNLNDRILGLRVALYGLFSQSQVTCSICSQTAQRQQNNQCTCQVTLISLIDILCLNSIRFSGDFNFIALAMKEFAVRNSQLIQQNLSLLLADRMSQEIDWFKEEHILKMIITKNALDGQETNLPFYYHKHIGYLLDKYPQYFIVGEVTKAQNDIFQFIKANNILNLQLSKRQNKLLVFLTGKYKYKGDPKLRPLVEYFKIQKFKSQFKLNPELERQIENQATLGLLTLFRNRMNETQEDERKFKGLVQYCIEQLMDTKDLQEIRDKLEQFQTNSQQTFSERLQLIDFINKNKKNPQLSSILPNMNEKKFEIISKEQVLSTKSHSSIKLSCYLINVDEPYQKNSIQILYSGGKSELHKIFKQDLTTMDDSSQLLDTEIILRQAPLGSTSMKVSLISKIQEEILDCLPVKLDYKYPKVGQEYQI